jgi:hypothetical protein
MVDSIKNYCDYLQCVKNWGVYSVEQQVELRKWYRDYYSQNKLTERLRYRKYYANFLFRIIEVKFIFNSMGQSMHSLEYNELHAPEEGVAKQEPSPVSNATYTRGQETNSY